MKDNYQKTTGFELTDGDYLKLSRLIYDTAGIHLGDNKKELVHARLSKIIRNRNLGGFKEYMDVLRADTSGDELTFLLDAISTNVTHFFREEKHFEFLATNFTDRGNQGGLRIWSAGCSSGEEPYTIAITLRERILKPGSPAPFILATDLSTKVLAKAKSATYPMKTVDKLELAIKKKYFLRGKGASEGLVRVKRDVTGMVTFRRLNLIEPFNHAEQFDIIFCRNVMIYFDTVTRQSIVRKFSDSLFSGGDLIIGHSESLNGIQHGLQYIKPTIYRKR